MGWFGPSGDCSCCESGPLACCTVGALGQATLSGGTGCETVAHGSYGIVTHLGGCVHGRDFLVLTDPAPACVSDGSTWTARLVGLLFTIIDSGGVSARAQITWNRDGASTNIQTRYEGTLIDGTCAPWTVTLDYISTTDGLSVSAVPSNLGPTMTVYFV